MDIRDKCSQENKKMSTSKKQRETVMCRVLGLYHFVLNLTLIACMTLAIVYASVLENGNVSNLHLTF